MKDDIGDRMYNWLVDLFPICRSLTGRGNRKTLKYLKNIIPEINIFSVESGTKAFDWIVPDEWTINEAYIKNESGEKIVDFKVNNLHLVSYSIPVNATLNRQELDLHLHSLPGQPNAIPYITSYYSKNWGFCLTHEQRMSLRDGMYHVVIDSELKPGVMNYGELVIPGSDNDEILLSTYICHPSLANNELSGPVVSIALAQWIMSLRNNRYTYRVLFLPETIGAIVYLSKYWQKLVEHVKAGFVITCVGDNNQYSFVPSRNGNTIADRAAKLALDSKTEGYKEYTFLERGSDERQYCSPGIDLPICSIMRTKYSEFPEYHTSLDNLNFVTPKGLLGGYSVIKKAIEIIEGNYTYKVIHKCEPQLGKRGLYPTTSTASSGDSVRTIMNVLAYSDGKNDLMQLANILDMEINKLAELCNKLCNSGVLKKV